MLEKFDCFFDTENNCYQVRTRSSAYSLEFDDKEREKVFIAITQAINQDPSTSLRELVMDIKKVHDHAKVLDVLQILSDNGLLSSDQRDELSGKEGPFQELGISTNSSASVTRGSVIVLSNGSLGERVKKLALSTVLNVELASFSEDISSVIKGADFVVADASRWSPYHLEKLNRFALLENLPWLYVGGVEETCFKVGPLFHGRETGCYNCLASRIKSNHEYPVFLSSYEHYLRSNKIASKPDLTEDAELYENIVANYLLIEVKRFFAGWPLPITWQSVVSFDKKSFQTQRHMLLRKPYCEECRPELRYNPAPWLEPITLK